MPETRSGSNTELAKPAENPKSTPQVAPEPPRIASLFNAGLHPTILAPEGEGKRRFSKKPATQKPKVTTKSFMKPREPMAATRQKVTSIKQRLICLRIRIRLWVEEVGQPNSNQSKPLRGSE